MGRRSGGPGRLPGLAGRGDRPPRQQRRVGHRPPRQCDGPPGRPRLHPRPELLPGPDRRPWGQPEVHPARRLRRNRLVRPPAVRFPRHGHAERGPRLSRLAAHGRHALPGDHGRDVGPGPPPLRGGDRRADHRGHRGDRLANPARSPGDRPAGGHRRGPPADRGGRRRAPGAHPAFGLEPDPPRCPGRRHLGGTHRPDDRLVLHRPDVVRGSRRHQRRRPRRRSGRATAVRDDDLDVCLDSRRAHPGRHDPGLRRPHEAPDHRAPARDDGAGDGPGHPPGPRHPAWQLDLAGRLDDDRRDAGGGLGKRDQLLPRPRHRPADDPDPAPPVAGPRGRARSGASCSGSSWASSRSP